MPLSVPLTSLATYGCTLYLIVMVLSRIAFCPPGLSLIIIDVQHAFDEWEAEGLRRNNPVTVALISLLRLRFGQTVYNP